LSFGTGVYCRALEFAAQRKGITADLSLLGTDTGVADTVGVVVVIDTGRRRIAIVDTHWSVTGRKAPVDRVEVQATGLSNAVGTDFAIEGAVTGSGAACSTSRKRSLLTKRSRMTCREGLRSRLLGVSAGVDRIGLGLAGGGEITAADIAHADGFAGAFILIFGATFIKTNISAGLNNTSLGAALACYGGDSSTSTLVSCFRVKLATWWKGRSTHLNHQN
jgi:hypothetical protein